MLRALFLTVAAVAVTTAAAAPASAGEAPVIAVLYFDNNTGDPKLDVLQKGFADMMITDLAAVPDVVVVERDKLQKVLDELELQKGAYFDKKTAVSVGKGLGARYAVSGSFAAFEPKIRIDVRMIDIATSKVVVATKVTGPADDIFALEQKLVGKFVGAMKREFDPPARPKTKVPDVDILLEYSKGIDQADRGNFKQAETAMGLVVKRAPTFGLARIRRGQFKTRLAAARKKRESMIDVSGQELVKNAKARLASKISKLTQDEAKTYIAYRIVYGEHILRELREQLGGKRGLMVIKRGHEARAKKLMIAYYDNTTKLLSDLEAYGNAHAKTTGNGVVYLDTSFRLPKDDAKRARAAGMGDSLSGDATRWKIELAEFLLLGKCDAGKSDNSYSVGPPLAELAKKYRKRGYKLLDQAWKDADAEAKKTDRPWQAVAALTTHGEALILRGKIEQGISKWQKILDEYPTFNGYERVEGKIKKELGLKHDHRVKELERYAKGLKGCNDMDLRVGWDTILYVRARTMGIDAIPHTVKEIEKSCSGNAKLKRFWSYLYSHAALAAARYGDCEWFDEYMKRYLAAGGSKSSAAGYRKNYSTCP
jgi:TolB-like protein